jgi:glycogen operon protein
MGSPDLYPDRGPIATINFITAHDGFTLMDLVSYDRKHNETNHESKESGTNDNYSWNSGVEGPTDDLEVNAIRHLRLKSAIALLMVSQGTPMILMGDESGRTQKGNNNAFCQDNEISWMDWNLIEQNADIFEFFKACIAFRRAHPVLRSGTFLSGKDYRDLGYADITFHGVKVGQPDWSEESCALAFVLGGGYAKGGLESDNHVYVAMNMHPEEQVFDLPPAPGEARWHLFAHTGRDDGYWPGNELILDDQERQHLMPYSVLVLVGK